MSHALINNQELINLLQNKFAFTKTTTNFMSGGVCPQCKKKELFTDAKEPKAVKCNRLNNCGYYETVRDLYPDLFENLTQKVPPTEQDPNATAKAYLNHVRGLNVERIKDSFEQGSFINTDNCKATATVRFFFNKEKTSYWERLIDFNKSDFKAKAHFGGKRKEDGSVYKGDWWGPVGDIIDPMRPIYMVEGIFDSLALMESGYQARSLMTCHNFPENALKDTQTTNILIFALDNNAAGWRSAKKHVAAAKDMGFAAYAAIPETDNDWNDLYQRASVTAEGTKRDPAKTMQQHMEKAIWKGARMLASSAKEAAAYYVMQTRQEYRIFQHNNALWEAKIDLKDLVKRVAGDDEEDGHAVLNKFLQRDIFDNLTDEGFNKDIQSCLKMKKISNCIPKFEYQQVDQYNDEARLNYFEISYENGSPKSTISIAGTALADAGAFNQALLRNTPGARFTGGKNHIEYLHEKVWFFKPAKEVKTVNFVGYDKKSQTYVFNKVAFRAGKRYELNSLGFFDMREAAIKTVNQDIRLNISNQFNPQQFMHDFEGAYAERGLIVLAWWVGTMFAEQLRHHFQGFPFFELQGQASSGKSTLIKILWKLFGRSDYEGFNPLNSSFSAIDRNFAKVANLPVVLIESDANDEQRNAKKFNWEHLKNAYTGEPLKERGVNNGGNETVFNPFRGALMAAQNTAIDGSEAILSRFIHLPLDRSHHKPGGKAHAENLARMEVEQLSGFLPYLLRHEQQIIKRVIELQPKHYESFNESIRIARIKDNHAIVMAILEVLVVDEILPITPQLALDAAELIQQRAAKRQLDTQVDHPEVQRLWDIYELHNARTERINGVDKIVQLLNHANKTDQIAINLTHFEAFCRDKGIKAPDTTELKRHLQQTHAHTFVKYDGVNSKIFGKTVRCYIFNKKD